MINQSFNPSIWRQRIGYGVSDFACNLIWQMISLYLLYFYTDIMRLSATSVALMFLVTRFIDGITDLLVGYWIDHTQTRWGKSRPFFLFGAMPFALFAILAFNVPDISDTGKLIYAYVTYIGLSFAYTIVNIPMASILPALTNDTNERTMLSTSRKFFGFLGATVVSFSALTLVDWFGNGDQALGFRVVMIVFGAVSCLLFFFTFASVREQASKSTQQIVGLKESLISLQKNRPWKIFALNILFMWTGFFIQTGAIVYYYLAVVGDKSLSITVATLMSIIPMLANFLVPFCSKRLGKRNLFQLSSMIQLFGLVGVWFAGVNYFGILISVSIMALGYGMKESIYFSMQADPVDYGEWKTGVNVAGSLSAINGFLGKIAQAVGGGISALLLSWGHYQAGAEIVSTEAVIAIETMYLYLPMLLIICSIITMSFYDLDKQYPRIKAALELGKREGDA